MVNQFFLTICLCKCLARLGSPPIPFCSILCLLVKLVYPTVSLYRTLFPEIFVSQWGKSLFPIALSCNLFLSFSGLLTFLICLSYLILFAASLSSVDMSCLINTAWYFSKFLKYLFSASIYLTGLLFI